MRIPTFLLLAGLTLVFAATHAGALVYTQGVYYAPLPTTYLQPAPAVIATPTVVPAATYPQSTTVYRPALGQMATVTPLPLQPVVQSTYYAPQAAYAPQPVAVARPLVSAPVQVVTPTPIYSTRYRPILGGTVTRAWYP